MSGKHTSTFKHISTFVEAKQQHNEKDRNNKCTCFMTLHISSSQTCVFQSLKRAGVKATLHQPANGGTSPCANVLRATTGSGYQPAMRGGLLAEIVHGTYATAIFSKRRLLLLLLLILITGVNAGAYEMHLPASHCNATATFVGHHWVWLPASFLSSLSLLQMSRAYEMH